MNKILSLSLSVCTTCLLLITPVVGQEKPATSETELTLENLFPPKSMFGPSARSPELSEDGRYAAYLYRTYPERRHGSDLWIYDFKTGKNLRLTNIEMMSEFQRSARLVIEDRLDKGKKANTKSADEDSENTDKKSEEEKDEAADRDIFLNVSDDDADDEYAIAYSGISAFRWHPTENKLLVMSEGDIYAIEDIETPSLKRLTKTSERESQVDYLPDGSGYSYRSDDAVMQADFESHLIQQLNPSLPSGEELSRYALSHDAKRLVIVTRKGSRSGSRQVDIIRYRDRFAKSDKISRTVSDDEVGAQTIKVYLYEIESAEQERSPLIQVFEDEIDEPRDVISSPNWSLDNNQITFCFFDQKNSEVLIKHAKWPSEEELDEALKEAAKKRNKEFEKKMAEAKEKDDEDGTPGRRGPSGGRTEAPELVMHDAKTVYQFKHYGGPNTPSMVEPDFAGDNQHIVFISEQSGFRHVHKLDPLYESVQQLTNGRYEVYPIRYSTDHNRLFVTATKDSAARRMVYELDLETGELNRLSKQDGTYSSVAVSNDGEKLISNFVTYGQLTELVVQNGRDKAKAITDSHPEKAKALTKIKPEFFDYTNRHGHSISGMMFKPKDWNKQKKHPLLIYVYGGPLGSRHSVTDGSYSSDAYFFQMYMAQKHGYLTIVVDPRGQSGYGGLFEKSNYEQVGKPQVEDLVDSVNYMADNYNIDNERVAIYGWSFGGFQTQMCLYTEPEVFQVGIAGAGPTQWENYNSWYTTGTVGPSRKGQPDQEKYSLLPLAKNLEGQLLLIHGMEDTNVLFQDTVAVYRELLKAGKETNVELFLDPTGGHGLGGDVKRIGRMRKYEEFLLRTIGTAE